MSNKKILLVDDEPEVLDMLKIRLKPLGLDLITASDGEQALEVIKKELPSMIILDVMMPKMDGFDVCKRIRSDKKTSHLPVIFLTVLGKPEERAEGIRAGGQAFIQKPYEPAIFIKEVNRLLDEYSPDKKAEEK